MFKPTAVQVADVKEAHTDRGRKTAVRLLNSRNHGESRKQAAKRLFALAEGSCNITDAERWFDEGIRAQLNDLGFE